MVDMKPLQQQVSTETDEAETPKLIKWLVVAIVIAMPYQLTYLPLPVGTDGGGYIVDVVILLLFGVGWGIMLLDRIRLRFPLLAAHVMIVIGSLLGTFGGVDRVESLTTLLRDMYVWLLFYTVINLVRERRFLHQLIKIWVVVAVLESALIMVNSVFPSDQSMTRVGLNDTQSLQELGVPSLANFPSELRQASHLIKRAQIRSYGLFTPGFGKGTFANADFTANYLAVSMFLALAVPLKRWRWLRFVAMGFIGYACYLTTVSSQLGVIPISLGLYIFLTSSSRTRLLLVVAGALVISVALWVYLGAPFVTGVDVFEIFEQSESEVAPMGFSGMGAGLEDRIGLVTDGWREFRDYPLGLGPHGMRSSGLEKNVHNEYVAYLYERGFLGFAGVLFMHLVIVVLAVTSMRTDNRVHRAVMAGLLAAYSMAAINDLAHELSRQRDVWMLFILVVAYASVELRRIRAQRRATLVKEWPWAYPDGAYSVAQT